MSIQSEFLAELNADRALSQDPGDVILEAHESLEQIVSTALTLRELLDGDEPPDSLDISIGSTELVEQAQRIEFMVGRLFELGFLQRETE